MASCFLSLSSFQLQASAAVHQSVEPHKGVPQPEARYYLAQLQKLQSVGVVY